MSGLGLRLGKKQGYAVSPWLFNVFVDATVREVIAGNICERVRLEKDGKD